MDVERTIEFIVAQQAQFSADIGALKERSDAVTRQIQTLAGKVDSLTGDVGVIERATRALIQIGQENRDQINEDRAAIRKNNEAIREHSVAILALREDFQSMLKVVEGLVRGKNGGSRPN